MTKFPRRSKKRFYFLMIVIVMAGILSHFSPAKARAVDLQKHSDKRPWMNQSLSPDKRADLLLARMTFSEKVHMLHTVSTSTLSREVPPIPRLGIPALKLNNGPAGVSSGGVLQHAATALPAPIGLAATWDPNLAKQYGEVEGSETWNQGRNLLEGPDVNIMRVPENGRTFEAYGEDPYLASKIAVGDINGIQSQGVIANVKHYIANNQETNRSSVSADVSQKALREIYLPAFKAAVQQGKSGSVMCAKNKVNGIYSCQNNQLLDGVLKKEYGFNGFVVSDFRSAHGTAAAANGGLDLELPDAKYYTEEALAKAVKSGEVSMATINGHVHRILRTMFRFGLFDRKHETRPINAKAHGKTARKIAENATVLLKNSHHVLPLNPHKIKSIAVIGSGTSRAVTGGLGSSSVAPLYTVSPLKGIEKRAGRSVKVIHAQGAPPQELGPPAIPYYVFTPTNSKPDVHGLRAQYFNNTDFKGDPVLTRIEPWVDDIYSGGSPAPGVHNNNYSIRWTGTFTAPKTGTYKLSLTSHSGSKLYLDGKLVIDDGGGFPGKTETQSISLTAGKQHSIRVDLSKSTGMDNISLGWQPPTGTKNPLIQQAVQAAKSSDVAVVFAGDVETEAIDRSNLDLPGTQNQLIEAVAKANKNTIVVLNTGGAVVMPWADQVSSIMEAWYPGEEDGNAIASVLFGDVNPSGKLPMTFPKKESDEPANTKAQYPGVNGVAHYSEGVFVGYRHYDENHIQPLFSFGHGLSYTTFAYSHLKVTPKGAKARADRKVSFQLTNTGHRSGAEVAQLYLGIPGKKAAEPPKQLKGFKKIYLRPGQTKHVTIRLSKKALSYWDTAKNRWVVPDGRYHIMIGSSSRDIRLQTDFQLQR